MHATLEKFGYPATLISEYQQWAVLLRPQQVTLGALVLICKDHAEAFSEIPAAAFHELARVTADIENTLGGLFAYDKINYLMLMMVDPHVHFHVVPRYQQPVSFAHSAFADPGWPGPPRLDNHTALAGNDFEALRLALLEAWPEVGI